MSSILTGTVTVYLIELARNVPINKFLLKGANNLFIIILLQCGVGSGGGHNYHPLSENCNFSRIELLLDLRPVCKFEFVHCGQVEKKPRVLYLSRLNCGGPTQFEIIFLNSEFEISNKIP